MEPPKPYTEEIGRKALEEVHNAESSASTLKIGSVPEIGKTLVCKTSQNEHRLLITTKEQVTMIIDMLIDGVKGWTIEA